MRNPRPVLIAAALLAALAQPAVALQIDNFEEGNFSLTDDVTPLTGIGPTLAEQSGLQWVNTWGGVRLVRALAASTGTATAAALLATTPIDDAAALSVVGVPDGGADFEFIYDGVANGEADGRFGALDLDLTPATGIDVSVTTVGTVVATIQLAMSSSSSTVFSSQVPLVNGLNSFLLSGFNILDLSDIQQVRLIITGIDVGEVVQMNYIMTVPDIVPEPGTGLLLSLGLVGFAIRRRPGAGLRSSISR
jgi:hypothetical protein